MKIGAFVPQGWRMDLNGVAQDNQWQTILDAANKIENLKFNIILRKIKEFLINNRILIKSPSLK